MAEGWLWFAALVACIGVFVLGLGLRWFLLEGPTLGLLSQAENAGIQAAPASSFPSSLRLVEAKNRLRSHLMRFVALGFGGVLLLVDAGPLGWLGVLLFFASFIADHVLLRPKNYELNDSGMTGQSLFTRSALAWEQVVCAHWRRYPGVERPPFPGGERIILEVSDGPDVEFVFVPKYGGATGAELAGLLLACLGPRLRVLQPRSQAREPESSRQLPPVQELAAFASDDPGVVSEPHEESE